MSNTNADEIAAFMNELEETRPARVGGRRGATYDILKPEFGAIYRNYAILSFNHGTSPLGADSVVVYGKHGHRSSREDLSPILRNPRLGPLRQEQRSCY